MAIHSSFNNAPRSRVTSQGCGLSVAIVLSDGFSMLTLGSVTESLALARRKVGANNVTKTLVGFPSRQLVSRSAIRVTADQAIGEFSTEDEFTGFYDAIFLCTGDVMSDAEVQTVLRLARCAKRFAKPLFVTGTAIHILAEYGLILRCTDHWSRLAALCEMVPEATISDAIFQRDGHIVTSPGESAACDLMVALIRDRFGRDVASEISSQLLIEGVRNGSRAQPRFAANRFRGVPRIVTTAIDMFETKIEDPPTTDDVAASVDVSVRQLERLFAKHVGLSPQKFSRRVRLMHAMRLLERSSMEIVEIAIACGFQHTATFNKQFKRSLGVTPSMYRQYEGCAVS